MYVLKHTAEEIDFKLDLLDIQLKTIKIGETVLTEEDLKKILNFIKCFDIETQTT